jgi:hypothetical protein
VIARDAIYSGTLAQSMSGAQAVGQQVVAPWFPGSSPITQGWGPSSYTGEPEGHGYAHWHAGVDVGLECGTVISLPHNLAGKAVWIDNPGGYGTALRLELADVTPGRLAGRSYVPPSQRRTVDVWLGHLRQRLVADGQQLRGGEHIAISNNTGNSTGCHLHFEVRPAGAKYGTDVDPSLWLLDTSEPSTAGTSSTAGPDVNPYASWDPRAQVWELEHGISAGITQAGQELLGVGQAALGTVLLAGGLIAVAFGMRGGSPTQLRSAAAGVVGRIQRRRAAGQREAARESTQAARAETAENRRYFRRTMRTPTRRGLVDRGEIAADRAATLARNRRRNQVSRVRISHQRFIQQSAIEAPSRVPAGRGARVANIRPRAPGAPSGVIPF